MIEPTYAAEAIDGAESQALLGALWADLRERYLGSDTDVDDERFGRDAYLADVGPGETSAPLGTFVVVRVDGQPVACGALRATSDPGVGEIKRMYVVPAARGRGLSRAVLVLLEEEAAQLGYGRLRLETGIKQPEAMALYESAGWVSIDKYAPWDTIEWSRCYGKELT